MMSTTLLTRPVSEEVTRVDKVYLWTPNLLARAVIPNAACLGLVSSLFHDEPLCGV